MQHVGITNALASDAIVHVDYYGGGSALSWLKPGSRMSMDAASTPNARRIHCVGISGNFRGSPYATCIAEESVLSLTVGEGGVTPSGTHH